MFLIYKNILILSAESPAWGGSLSRYVSEVLKKIEELKRRRNAVILAHNYQLPEVQDVADFVGDSLELARKAMEIDADVVVFAGVSFMAEMVAALNPDKIVLHPDPSAGCPLADYATPAIVKKYKEKYPKLPLILYVNSLSVAKALADYVVTSSSAVKLVQRLKAEEVLFGPDKNLADHVMKVTGIKVIPVPAYGHCPVHQYLIDEYHLMKALEEHPHAKVLVHPEAPPEVRERADFIGSTSQMLKAVGELEGEEFILGTEEGLAYRARRLYPHKRAYPLNPRAVCIDMKKITPLKILRSLETLKPRVTLERSLSERVREVIEKSLELLR